MGLCGSKIKPAADIGKPFNVHVIKDAGALVRGSDSANSNGRTTIIQPRDTATEFELRIQQEWWDGQGN